MEAIESIANPVTMVVLQVILWLKYKESIPEVGKQLETVIKEVAQGRRIDLYMYLSVMDWELRNAEDMLTQYNIWSTDAVTIALRMKGDNL